jgi:hypothetical protein
MLCEPSRRLTTCPLFQRSPGALDGVTGNPNLVRNFDGNRKTPVALEAKVSALQVQRAT